MFVSELNNLNGLDQMRYVSSVRQYRSVNHHFTIYLYIIDYMCLQAFEYLEVH